MIRTPGISSNQARELLNTPVPEKIRDSYHQSYPVTPLQQEEYGKNGFIKLTSVLSGEALDYTRRLIGAAVCLRKESDKRILSEKSAYEQSFLQCGYLCWDFPAVKEFVLASRFAGIARDLMKVEGVRLWHDQALYKEPGGRVTDMHQDISYWPVKTENTTTLWLALTDVNPNNGNLYFLPGTHTMELYEYVDIFKNPHIPERLKKSPQIDVPLKAGDATFHSGLTFHGARSNQDHTIREAMTIIYIGDGTRFDASDPRNTTHTSCKGLKHGEVIDTLYTPRLI
jgi:ectoine hydroxylase-related dioxygenase (phytanoyl-CoA dioxygenase family)